MSHLTKAKLWFRSAGIVRTPSRLARARCPCFALFLLALLLLLWGADPARAAAGDDTDVHTLIEQLADPDPSRRQEAADQLTGLGSQARHALLQASRSGDPQIAPRAAEILLNLPWHEPTDPPMVRQLLREYGRQDENGRRQIILQILNLPRPGTSALLRLIEQEPSAELRWTISELLSRKLDEKMRARIREIALDDAGEPLLVLAARAWLLEDISRSLELLRRAIDRPADAAPIGPQQYSGTAWAYSMLVEHALAADDVDGAAQLLRQRAEQELAAAMAQPNAVIELFALHAQRGPATGFEQDLHAYRHYLGRSHVIYALSVMYLKHDQHLLANALRQVALAAGLTSQQNHLAVGDWLVARGWNDLAEREYQLVLALHGEHKQYADAHAMYRLATLAGEAGEDAAAAEQLKQLVALFAPGGRGQPSGEMQALIEWRLLRAAQAANDEAQMAEHAERLLMLEPQHTDIATDLVPYLRERGKDDDAKAVFERAYKIHRAQLDADPTSAQEMNNLAWLCARSGERPQEALELATQAITIAPDNYAYLDTAAEAHYRLGNHEKAIALEERALQLKPGDRFMTEQLERFRAGLERRGD